MRTDAELEVIVDEMERFERSDYYLSDAERGARFTEMMARLTEDEADKVCVIKGWREQIERRRAWPKFIADFHGSN